MIILVTVTAFSWGMMICVKVLSTPAPSMAAASSSAVGMETTKLTYINMVPGMPPAADRRASP